jgi:hypothetical protein
MNLEAEHETIYVINHSGFIPPKKAHNITDLFIKYIEVLTISKVGTQNIVSRLPPKDDGNPNLGCHDLGIINYNNTIYKETPIIYVCGIRNPIEWAISYMFATYNVPYAGPQFKTNNYELINTFICERDQFLNMPINDIVNIFIQKKYYNIFNDFFKEFFEITGINIVAFNKEKGYQIYEYQPGRFILFYVLEKYDMNINHLSAFLNLNLKEHTNTARDECKSLNAKFKKTIKMPYDYKQKFIDTDYIKYFYTDDEINNMYNKY